MPIGGAVICAVLYFVILAIFWWGGLEGTVRYNLAYAAKDEQSLINLEQAIKGSGNLAAIAQASHGRIVALQPSTPVRYKDELFYDGQTLRSSQDHDHMTKVLKIKVEEGPSKGSVVLVNAQDIGFYSFP